MHEVLHTTQSAGSTLVPINASWLHLGEVKPMPITNSIPSGFTITHGGNGSPPNGKG